MNFKLSIISGSILAIFSLLVFFAILFLTVKRKHKKANIVFSLMLLVTAYNIFDFGFALNTDFHLFFPHILRTSLPFLFMTFPLMYLYIKIVTNHESAKIRLRLYHYLPALAVFLVMLPFYLKGGYEKIQLTQQFLANDIKPWYMKLIYPMLLVQAFPYLIYARKIIVNSQEWTRGNYSSIGKLYLNWLKYMVTIQIIGFTAIGIVFLITFLSPAITKYYRLVPIFVSIMSFALIIRALIQPVIVLGRAYNQQEGKAERNNVYPNMDHQKNRKKLEDLMEKQKIFLNSEISLSTLSEKMNVSRNYVSFLINELYNLSFYDFINKYRVEDIIKSMQNDMETSLLRLAYRSGFNSKTTFNVSFKKHTGITPTQYRENLKKGLPVKGVEAAG